MRSIASWLAPFVARRVLRFNPLWWPAWWIASRFGGGPARAALGWTGRKVANVVNDNLDRRMEDSRTRREAAAADPGPATGPPPGAPPSPPADPPATTGHPSR